MAVIGAFSKSADGYVGDIRTMTISVAARFVPNDKKSAARAPDFRVFAGDVEFGAAWRVEAENPEKKAYLSVELDDPSFAAPIRAALFDKDDGAAALIWSRMRKPEE